jgi:hypothetical protein
MVAAVLQTAVDTAWSIYRATYARVDDADSRRCLLERHLHERWEAREGEIEELASFGLAYHSQPSEEEC